MRSSASAPKHLPSLQLPVDLLAFLSTRVPQIEAADAWSVGGAWLTGTVDGPPLLPPGRAASVARALGEWIVAHSHSPNLKALDGAALLTERAAYTGWQRQGSTTLGGAGRLVPLRHSALSDSGGLAAVSCARPDDPLLYGAALGVHIPSGDPWPELSRAIAETDAAALRQVALDLSLACWPVEFPSRDGAPLPLAVDGRRRPRDLTGARVVDFSSLWAGPLCANLLGLAGAEVIKVESALRPDGARRGNRDFYHMLHAGHRAVSFTPTDPVSLAALDALVASADIVIEASRPRALERLGINADRHVASGTTWLSITAAGRASGRVGFGDDVAAAAGLIAKAATQPCFVGDAIADPLTGLLGAAICMTEPNTGGIGANDSAGELWDLSMTDVVRLGFAFAPADIPQPVLISLQPASEPLFTATPPRRRHRFTGPFLPEPPELGADNPELLGTPRPQEAWHE